MAVEKLSAKPVKHGDFAQMETESDVKITKQSLLLRAISGDGQNEVQRRLAYGQPAPGVKQSLRRAGVPIRQLDRALGKSARDAKKSLQAMKVRLKPCRDIMFAELDRIAKDGS